VFVPDVTAVEYGDAMLIELQGLGATSTELVGALNELNGTAGVEFSAALSTYEASGASGYYGAAYGEAY
jgi:hypothetical protein